MKGTIAGEPKIAISIISISFAKMGSPHRHHYRRGITKNTSEGATLGRGGHRKKERVQLSPKSQSVY